MHHRQLPQELRQAVRKYDQYKWVATRGVNEEALLKGLPLDLRRDIKRHLCYDLVRRVKKELLNSGFYIITTIEKIYLLDPQYIVLVFRKNLQF